MKSAVLCLFCFCFLFCPSILCAGAEKGFGVEWDQRSLTCVVSAGCYARMHRLSNGALMVAYEDGGNVCTKTSTDNGKSWSYAKCAFRAFDYALGNATCRVNCCNPEFAQLPNGDILIACNYRPSVAEVYPYAIAVARSINSGLTYQTPKVVYQAAPRATEGCWEPAPLVLPDSTVQLYLANESPYAASDEQEISMLTSQDLGVTWSTETTKVCFRTGHRDGMPVPIVSGKDLMVAIEDNVNGQFNPYVVRRAFVKGWRPFVSGYSSNRYRAHAEPLPTNVYAGAPYLIRTDQGVHLLSYQTTVNAGIDWTLSKMAVVAADSTGRGFRNVSYPFAVPAAKNALWNSLVDLGNGSVAAIASTNAYSDQTGIWMITGKVVNYDAVTDVEPVSVEGKDAAFPNPFSNELNIPYRVDENFSLVEVVITNLLGGFVNRLVTCHEGAGSYCMQWQPAALSEGTYLYSVCVNGTQTTTGKTLH
ncbi:MAG: sialidase family protein [Bacteroidales bacterium]|nr:sialidase family protein [Bacteroidales bacterium]